MEKFKMLEKDNLIFNVGNKGNIQILGSERNGIIKTFSEIDFSRTGGHVGKRYLSTHGQYVHRLVAEAWIGEIPEGYEVNHKDGNKTNNEISNLKIVTPSENIRHSFEFGNLRKNTVSEEELNRRAEIKAELKYQKRWAIYNLDFQLLKTYETVTETAKSLNISRQAIYRGYKRNGIILKNYYICRIKDTEEYKKRIELKRRRMSNV